MNYTLLVGMIFPAYVVGCILACLLNLHDKRSFSLAVSYSFFIIILYQFMFWGKAPEYKWHWYVLLTVTHGIMAWAAELYNVKASKAIASLSCAAIMLNSIYLLGWFTYPLPRQGFFLGMNLIQILQIFSLVAVSPLWHYTYSKLRHPRTKDEPWMLMEIPPG